MMTHHTQGHLSYFSVKTYFVVPLDKNKASKITGFHQKQAHNITWTYSSHNQEIDLNVLVCNGHHAIEKWRFWLTNREVNQSFILPQGNTIGISEHRRNVESMNSRWLLFTYLKCSQIMCFIKILYMLSGLLCIC